MAEDTIKDPRDLNGDGKVTLDEKIKYAAAQAGKKISEVAGDVKDKSKELYDKAAPKAKEAFAGVKEKGAALADKAKGKFAEFKAKKEAKSEEGAEA